MWTYASKTGFATLLLSLSLLWLTAASCGDKKGAPVAELVELLEGKASQLKPNRDWGPADAGALFRNGDALRTDSSGIARIRFVGELLRMGPSTTIFFGKKNIDFDGEIEVGQGLAQLGIDFGSAEVTATGRLRLKKRSDEIRFEVLLGRATITNKGLVTDLQTGEELVFELGNGSIEKLAPVDAGLPDALSIDAAPPTPVAIAVAVKGRGVRAQETGGEWNSLKAGDHEILAKTAVALKKRSTITIKRGNDQVTVSGPANLVIGGAELVRLGGGTAQVVSKDASLAIAVPGGSVRVHPKPVTGRVRISVDKRKKTNIKVQTGRATLEGKEGSKEIQLGDSGSIDLGGVVQASAPGPTNSHLTLYSRGGEVTLHDPNSPTNLRVDFSKDCEYGVVEVAKRNFRRPQQQRPGAGSAVIRLGSGRHRYRVRCFEDGELAKKPVSQSTIHIRKDAGGRPLPRKAPHNSVDADGRKYSVLYQNRLPAITFRWPRPIKAERYVLHVVAEDKSRRKRVVVNKPLREFKSGVFKEGGYQFWFETDGKTSKTSRLSISFDNAAATGYLSSPGPRSDLSSSRRVRVAGAAVSGWTVSVRGQRLKLDGQHRFDESVAVSKDGSVAVRFAHPKHGVHVYLRR